MNKKKEVVILRVLSKQDKPIDLETHGKIVGCPYYVSKFVGTIFCKDRKRFVQLNDCKVCRVGRGR